MLELERDEMQTVFGNIAALRIHLLETRRKDDDHARLNRPSVI